MDATLSVYIDVAVVTPGFKTLKYYDSQPDHYADHQSGEGKNRPGWRGGIVRLRLDEAKAA